MNFLQTAKLLLQFGFRPIRGDSHAARLESFYGYQSHVYDDYREKFLILRRELVDQLPLAAGVTWVDFGCGTGYLLECAGERARQCRQIYLVDVTPSLLAVARRRVAEGGWTNATIVERDATQFVPDQPIDVATFSYSLTMMPNWFAAIDHVAELLAPGGTIGVVDFFVARKHNAEGIRHGWLTRHFWPAWFDVDNVRPSSDHIEYLRYKFEQMAFAQTRTRVVGMPWLWPPCCQFIGIKR